MHVPWIYSESNDYYGIFAEMVDPWSGGYWQVASMKNSTGGTRGWGYLCRRGGLLECIQWGFDSPMAARDACNELLLNLYEQDDRQGSLF